MYKGKANKSKFNFSDDSAEEDNYSDSADYIGEGEPDIVETEDVPVDDDSADSIDSTEGLDVSDDSDGENGEDVADESSDVDLKDVSKYNREIVIVHPDDRRTSDILSKFEMTEIISIRATQISQFNNAMVDIAGLTSPIDIAKRELMNRMCPLMLRRMVGELKNEKTGVLELYAEDWCPNDMIFSTTYHCC